MLHYNVLKQALFPVRTQSFTSTSIHIDISKYLLILESFIRCGLSSKSSRYVNVSINCWFFSYTRLCARVCEYECVNNITVDRSPRNEKLPTELLATPLRGDYLFWFFLPFCDWRKEINVACKLPREHFGRNWMREKNECACQRRRPHAAYICLSIW